MSFLLGLDAGTTKISAAVLDSGSGEVVLALSRPTPPPQAPGRRDPRAIAETAFALIRAATERLPAPPSVLGLCGQMHGVLLASPAGRSLSPLFDWQDASGSEPSPEGPSWTELFSRRLGKERLDRTGVIPSPGYGGITLLRLARSGNIPPGSVPLTIHDFLVLLLTGRACTSPSNAASWGLLDLRSGRWLEDAEDLLGLPPGVLPEILPSASVAAALTPRAAELTGIPAGTPVAAAAGDNQASFLGSVPSLHRFALLNIGTGGQVSVPTPSPVLPPPPGLELRPLLPGSFLLVGASLCGGRAYGILRDFLADVGRSLFRIEPPEDLFERMNALASEAPPGSEGLSFRTTFAGTRLDPDLRGSLLGMSETNFSCRNLVRAAVTGMASELLDLFLSARPHAPAVKALATAGNAVRENPVAREEIRRLFRLPLHVPPHREEAACGAALYAGVAAGTFSDWSSALATLHRPDLPTVPTL